jgi:hypothetical protein
VIRVPAQQGMVTATNSEEIPWIKPEDVWPDKNTWSFAARGTHKVAVGGAIRVARTQVHTDATPFDRRLPSCG